MLLPVKRTSSIKTTFLSSTTKSILVLLASNGFSPLRKSSRKKVMSKYPSLMFLILYSVSSKVFSLSARKMPRGWIPISTVFEKSSCFSINWQAKRLSAMFISVAFSNTFWLIGSSELYSGSKSTIFLVLKSEDFEIDSKWLLRRVLQRDTELRNEQIKKPFSRRFGMKGFSLFINETITFYRPFCL